MSHSYLSKKNIFLASAQKHITNKESRELVIALNKCKKLQKSKPKSQKKKRKSFIINY